MLGDSLPLWFFLFFTAVVLYGSESKNTDDVLQSEWCHRTQELEQLAKTVDYDFLGQLFDSDFYKRIYKPPYAMGDLAKHLGLPFS